MGGPPKQRKAPGHYDASASARGLYLIPGAAQDQSKSEAERELSLEQEKQKQLELLFFALAQQTQEHHRCLQLIDSKLTTILNVILHKADLEPIERARS
jgi:hypothetical protein